MNRLSSLLHMLPVVLAAVSGSLGIFNGHEDIGHPERAGSAEFDGTTATYRVSGGGSNIWGASDEFRFVYKQVTGDLTITADVNFQGNSSEPHRKAALMIRQSLDPDSAYADIAVHGDGTAALQYRPSVGVATSEFRVAWRHPTHLSLMRRGNEFTVTAGDGSRDHPGESGPVIVGMSGPVYVGLAVCAHNARGVESAVFRNVRVTVAMASLNPSTLLQLVAEHTRVGLPLR